MSHLARLLIIYGETEVGKQQATAYSLVQILRHDLRLFERCSELLFRAFRQFQRSHSRQWRLLCVRLLLSSLNISRQPATPDQETPRNPQSVGFCAAASTLTRTSFGPGCGILTRLRLKLPLPSPTTASILLEDIISCYSNQVCLC